MISRMISKACYKPQTIFISISVKDCLFIDIAEIKFLSLLSKWEKKIFARTLVEIPFYVIYFTDSTISVPSRQKMF